MLVVLMDLVESELVEKECIYIVKGQKRNGGKSQY